MFVFLTVNLFRFKSIEFFNKFRVFKGNRKLIYLAKWGKRKTIESTFKFILIVYTYKYVC